MKYQEQYYEEKYFLMAMWKGSEWNTEDRG